MRLGSNPVPAATCLLDQGGGGPPEAWPVMEEALGRRDRGDSLGGDSLAWLQSLLPQLSRMIFLTNGVIFPLF